MACQAGLPSQAFLPACKPSRSSVPLKPSRSLMACLLTCWPPCIALAVVYIQVVFQLIRPLQRHSLSLQHIFLEYGRDEIPQRAIVSRSSPYLREGKATHETQEGPAALASTETKRDRRKVDRDTWLGGALQVDATPRERRVTPAKGIRIQLQSSNRRRC
jgi:hypothetical protein